MSEDSVIEVLTRSQDAPSFPFTGNLEYNGVSVSILAVREYVQSEITTLSREIVETAPDYISKDRSEIIRKDLVYTETIASSLLEVCSLFDQIDTDKYEYVLLEYNETVLVVQPEYGVVFNIYPDDSNQEFYGIVDSVSSSIPQSPPQMSSVHGEFSKTDSSKIEFRESSLLSRLVNRATILLSNITVETPAKIYDIPSLQSEPVLASQLQNTAEYCSVEIFISNGDCVLKCDHSDGPVTFRLPLTEFHTLPEWTSERLDPSDMLLKMDTNQNLLAKVKTATESTPVRWRSELEDMELLTVE